MTERALQRKVMNWLRSRGQFINKSPSQWDRSGVPDILGCHGFMGATAIELKAPGRYKNPWDGCSHPQKRWLRRWHDAGGVAIVADSLETVQQQLEHRGSNIPDE